MQLNKTFERLKKMISKGIYERESILMDLNDFLEMGTITNESYNVLLEMLNSAQIDKAVSFEYTAANRVFLTEWGFQRQLLGNLR